jgi:hypothetical protein
MIVDSTPICTDSLLCLSFLFRFLVWLNIIYVMYSLVNVICTPYVVLQLTFSFIYKHYKKNVFIKSKSFLLPLIIKQMLTSALGALVKIANVENYYRRIY